MTIPRPEHPKPQFQREDWLNLNCEWDFTIDNGRSGQARRLYEDGVVYDLRINVPFCPQSKLSGLQHRDFLYGVWYRRKVTIEESKLGGFVFLHIGAAVFFGTKADYLQSDAGKLFLTQQKGGEA